MLSASARPTPGSLRGRGGDRSKRTASRSRSGREVGLGGSTIGLSVEALEQVEHRPVVVPSRHVAVLVRPWGPWLAIDWASPMAALIAGAIGAVVSVIQRIDDGRFALDYDVGGPYAFSLGGLRPLVGGALAVAISFAFTGGPLHLPVSGAENDDRRLACSCSASSPASASAGHRARSRPSSRGNTRSNRSRPRRNPRPSGKRRGGGATRLALGVASHEADVPAAALATGSVAVT